MGKINYLKSILIVLCLSIILFLPSCSNKENKGKIGVADSSLLKDINSAASFGDLLKLKKVVNLETTPNSQVGQ